MDATRIMRGALWTTAVFNLGAALLVALPASPPGQLVGLPASVPVVYRALLAHLIALFGVAYAWLARQPRIDRPLVAMAAAGKAGTFVVGAACWLGGYFAGRGVLLTSGDLVFAAIFAWWLLGTDGASGEESWES